MDGTPKNSFNFNFGCRRWCQNLVNCVRRSVEPNRIWRDDRSCQSNGCTGIFAFGEASQILAIVQVFNARDAKGAWGCLDYTRPWAQSLVLARIGNGFMGIGTCQRAAKKKGFRAFYCAGRTWSATMPCSFSSCGPNAQLLGLWVEDWWIASVNTPFLGEMTWLTAEMFVATNAQTNNWWVLCGDANETPGSSAIERNLVYRGGSLRAIHRPTRWEGEHEIDWMVSNAPVEIWNHTGAWHVSCLEVKICLNAACSNWSRPPKLPRAEWKAMIETRRRNLPPEHQTFSFPLVL